MNPRPRLIVTLPARTVAEVRSQRGVAVHAGADVLEVRVDRWTSEQRSRVGQLFPSPVPLLATLRSQAEGGEGPNDPTERATWIEQVAGHPFAWIDLELERDPPPTPGHAGTPPRWVGSRHFPAETPLPVLEDSIRASPERFAFTKFVVPASVERYYREIRPRLPEWVGPRTTVFTTGPSGPLGRLWARELGQPVVFASLPLDDVASTGPPVEPAQVPVDQLHRSWAVEPGRKFAVVGHPIAHSLSPTIHAGWLATERRAASFVDVDVASAEELRLLADPATGERWDGWSVTAPWKSLLPGIADHCSDSVVATGVANTAAFGEQGTSVDLTDAEAVRRRSLELVGEGAWDGTEALVLGTGGSARAALYALAPKRRTVHLLGRRAEAVERLSKELGGRPANPRDRHAVGLVVHATTFGRAGSGPLALDVDGWVGPGTTVLDFVYAPEDSTLRRRAESLGARYEDGRRLLVYQAADAHRIWWGEAPSEAAVASALRRVGCAA
ncbi:MAG: type I 3-dehydroquinate dehydratase [Thermoplasmata archaeon]|nr:type I 3-dehydroquinate dehydratase [Thermoplasmata archaeon]